MKNDEKFTKVLITKITMSISLKELEEKGYGSGKKAIAPKNKTPSKNEDENPPKRLKISSSSSSSAAIPVPRKSKPPSEFENSATKKPKKNKAGQVLKIIHDALEDGETTKKELKIVLSTQNFGVSDMQEGIAFFSGLYAPFYTASKISELNVAKDEDEGNERPVFENWKLLSSEDIASKLTHFTEKLVEEKVAYDAMVADSKRKILLLKHIQSTKEIESDCVRTTLKMANNYLDFVKERVNAFADQEDSQEADTDDDEF